MSRRSTLGSPWLGNHRIYVDACASTNDEAARLARAGAAHGTVVIATTQTAGRGREGRSWASPAGGLYLSAVMRPPLPLADVPPMTLAIGVAICDAVRAVGAPAVIKWPNDLLVDGRKLAGVLVEAHSQGGKLDAVVVGIGMNLERTPEAVATTAISLAEAVEVGGRVGAGEGDRETFVTSLLARVESWVDRYVAVGLPAIIPAWRERMAPGFAARATINGLALTGEVCGLDDDGALVLRDAGGRIHRVLSGDVDAVRGDSAHVH